MVDIDNLNIPTKSSMGLIMLSSMKGFGRVAIKKIIDNFDTIADFISADDSNLDILNIKQRENIRDSVFVNTAYNTSKEQHNKIAEIGASIISLYDDAYPKRLRGISDAPLVLYAAGDMSILENGLAFVGTREPTDFGQKVARGMSYAAAEDGHCIVSGLARGVDAVCHNAAVDAKGTTCAVLASGLDLYTSDIAMKLAQRILENGGLLITEQPLGAEANRGSYIARDRLITGLSLATFFIQGEAHSGSMHSVRYAISQNRPVYVPNIPERFLSEQINETARNLGILTVGQIASKFDWTGRVMEVVNKNPDATAASLVMNRDDYPRVFEEIKNPKSAVLEPIDSTPIASP